MISIILAIYHYIYKKEFTLGSIISQRYLDYEIIVADDCSKKTIPTIIEFMIEKNICRYKVIRGEKIQGMVRNLLNALHTQVVSL